MAFESTTRKQQPFDIVDKIKVFGAIAVPRTTSMAPGEHWRRSSFAHHLGLLVLGIRQCPLRGPARVSRHRTS